ncbi:hypothetical protein CP556_14540 [Natrinema sp. CBA1119]|uniref:hypothetical protein n=1 Tax=Natrinema sp. CBA1119 TaxID=1608465 RepID=UPI000BFA7CB9|nr:hypothetical protein [Natrinema sp. CBA1119]PGF17203.1 hypothetical protein CP556_14540 [Natrinema sp. CBA1119]
MTGLPGRLDLDAADVTPDVPVAELTTTTRRAETRAVMAVVAELRAHGVPVRDIVVVARDLERYEEPLTRAAVRYGITPVFWTQIDLVTSRPYRLVIALCELIAASNPARDVLFRPLELGWVPQDSGDEWPVPAETVVELYHETPCGSRSVEAWQSLLQDAAWADPRIIEFVEWVVTSPNPSPETVADVLGGVVASYRESVLPQQQATDSPALLETETAARAVVRMETLVEQVESKYAQRVADGWSDESWVTVAGICESLATQRPGRREHANALALDILEANDIWARKIPFVIAVGLVDGEWPRQRGSVVPAEFQHAILAGNGPAKRLSPQTAWMDGRDHDHFLDTVQAATTGLIVTRHSHDAERNRQFRSPLLDSLDVEPISTAARRRLLSTERALPDVIRSMLPGEASASMGVMPDD